jgi:acetoin utilization deacetylase AcuC-like enzyme
LPATFALRRKTRPTSSLHGRGGYYMMDLSACIVAGTYKAALASANCALSAAEESVSGQSVIFCVVPPARASCWQRLCGRILFHQQRIGCGELAFSKGKVALLDIDYHGGNGTQDIFYERS